jgi:exopolyphosphatase/guanosine-5'-triphosphate,3'-diphosphate pyrophosphatase
VTQLLNQGRLDKTPVAVIDIGSNSVRLVVYEGAKRNPVPLFNEKVLCGLGRSLATSGLLNEDGVDRALRALQRFRAIADQTGAKRMSVIATAAAREASNGPDFVRRATQILGTEIKVVTGKEEARLAAAGVMSGFPGASGLVADLGGGSLEIINLHKKKGPTKGTTLPLGGLRLIDLSGGDLDKARKIVNAELDKIDWLEKGKGQPFYAVGGTWRAFGRLHMVQTGYPLSVMHAYKIRVPEALRFARVVDHLSPDSLNSIEALPKARRETVPYGVLVLERLLKRIAPSEFIVSAYGVREGLLYSMLPEKERNQDPLLVACDEMARLRSRSEEHARELCEWTDALFEPPGPEESPEEQRLRHAACLLSDIGWRAHPDYRGPQSLNLIAQANFAGLSHPGRAFLALSVFYRNQGLLSPDDSPRLYRLIDDKMLARARILGAAIRTAHMISAAMPGVIDKTPVFYEGKKLVLQIPRELSALAGERLASRFNLLAGELERDPEIRVAETADEVVTV